MDNNLSEWLIKDEENDVFFFESDHLALKGNKDYCDVLKTIVILSAQREKAIKDYNKVVAIKKKCLDFPEETYKKIQNGDDLGRPPPIELPKLPVINFDKYDVKVVESDIKAIYCDDHEKADEKNIKLSSNFNNQNTKVWSPEEQKKLEELLMVYPPEPIEMRRFQKIAAALGNRTVQQVTSRVQKYFIKLYKAGLPIPGRIPKQAERYKKTPAHKHQRYNHYLWKPTTFFPNLYVPVTMDEQENIPGPSITTTAPSTSSAAPSPSNSYNYLLSSDYHQSSGQTKSEDELQLQLLKRVKFEKQREQESGTASQFEHEGFKCDFCGTEPIIGSRWHCIICQDSIDFCTDCVISQMYSGNPHPLGHTLGIFHDDSEVPILSLNEDTDSVAGSGANSKYYGSDSNSSGDFDTDSNLDSLQDGNTCDMGMDSDDYQVLMFHEDNSH